MKTRFDLELGVAITQLNVDACRTHLYAGKLRANDVYFPLVLLSSSLCLWRETHQHGVLRLCYYSERKEQVDEIINLLLDFGCTYDPIDEHIICKRWGREECDANLLCTFNSRVAHAQSIREACRARATLLMGLFKRKPSKLWYLHDLSKTIATHMWSMRFE